MCVRVDDVSVFAISLHLRCIAVMRSALREGNCILRPCAPASFLSCLHVKVDKSAIVIILLYASVVRLCMMSCNRVGDHLCVIGS